MDPREMLGRGAEILRPALQGFAFRETAYGKGSGGLAASGEFRRDDRALELHCRYSLGLVTYQVGDLALGHEDYMRALLGPAGPNRYPGFSEDPIEGFEHLRHDIEHYASDFVAGPADEFRRCADATRQWRALTGPQQLAEYERALKNRPTQD